MLANAHPKPLPRVLTKGWKKKLRATLQDAAYAIVDARDGNIDRVTGRPVFPHTRNPEVWRTRHHMKPKSTHPELYDDPRNIIVCAWAVHQCLQSGAVQVEGDDANKRLIFRWNRGMVPVGREPFKIHSKRRSERREGKGDALGSD